MVETVILIIFKAAPGTLLVLWGIWGDTRSQNKLVNIAAMILFGAIYYIFNFHFPPFLYIGSTLVLCLAAMALSCLLFRRPLPASCILAVSSVMCIQIVQSLVISLVFYVVSDVRSFVDSHSAVNLLIEPVCILVTLPIVYNIRRFVLSQGIESFHFSQLAWFLPSLGVYLCLTLWQIPNFEDTYLEVSWVPLLLMGLMAVLGISVTLFPLYVFSISKERFEMERMELLATQYYESMLTQRENDDEIRRMVHDLRNQIQCALENVSEEAGRQQLEELDSGLFNLRFTSFTSNATVDTVLNQKRRLAVSKGVEFQVVPCKLPKDFMKGSDICAVISNALDNALEECERMSVDAYRYVDVKFSVQNDYLVMMFANSCSCGLGGCLDTADLGTSKKDNTIHGLGLSSIRYCIEKYQGSCTIDADKREFRLTVLIPLRVE